MVVRRAEVAHLATGRLRSRIPELQRPLGDRFTEHRLNTIASAGKRAADVIIAEVGIELSRFPIAGHLTCDTYLSAQFWRISRQGGKKRKAAMAVGRDQAIRNLHGLGYRVTLERVA